MDNKKINELINKLASEAKYLTHPRQIFHPMNHEDFPTQSAKDYFRKKKEASIEMSFEDAIKRSESFAKPVQKTLQALNNEMIYKYATCDYFTEDDIHIFPVLYSLTLALDALSLPKNINNYLNRIYQKTNIKPYGDFQYL